MKIHEYQAKDILERYGVAVPKGEVANTLEEAMDVAKRLFSSGAKGVERIVEIELAGKDREAFDKSVGAVQGLVDACKKIAPDLLGR